MGSGGVGPASVSCVWARLSPTPCSWRAMTWKPKYKNQHHGDRGAHHTDLRRASVYVMPLGGVHLSEIVASAKKKYRASKKLRWAGCI